MSPKWCDIREHYCQCDTRCEEDVLAVGYRCHGYWSWKEGNLTWRCLCGATNHRECRTETAGI